VRPLPPELGGIPADAALWQEASVRLERIDAKDPTYRITTRPCTDALTASIRSCGLIHPPLLKKKGSRLLIVSGFRRVEACRRCGQDSVQGRILSDAADKGICIRLAVTENALERSLNPLETARAAALISSLDPDPEAIAAVAADIGFFLHPAHIEKLLLLSRLPGALQDAVAEGLLLLPTALELGALDPAGAAILVDLFRRLKSGLNLQREMIRLAGEIALREATSIEVVLKAPDLQRILADPQADRVQKGVGVRRYLRLRRFPHLTEKEDAFRQCVKNLKLGEGVALHPPRDFEGSNYALTLYFNTCDTLIFRKRAVDRILADPDFIQFLSR